MGLLLGIVRHQKDIQLIAAHRIDGLPQGAGAHHGGQYAVGEPGGGPVHGAEFKQRKTADKGHHQAEYGKAGGEFLAYRHGVHGMSCIWVIKWHSSALALRGASTLAAIHSSHSNLIRIGTDEGAKRVSNRPSRGTVSCIGARGHPFRIFSENKPGWADGWEEEEEEEEVGACRWDMPLGD